MTSESGLQWTSAACSHVGLVRQINEDACLDQPERGMWAVADGMGGHSQGDVASRMAIDALDTLPPADSPEKFAADVHARLQAVNVQLRNEAALRHVHIIGTTVVVLLAGDRRCACLWAGDSRIYRYRDGRLTQLTRDHSQIEELRALGGINIEDVQHHPARNLITRALGAADTLDIDQLSTEVEDGDMFLLCSDGLSNEVSEPDICLALVSGDCRHAAKTLVDMALQGGGRDNVSVVVVRADDPYSTEKTVLNPSL